MNWRARVERGTPILYNLPPQNLYSYILGYCAELEDKLNRVQKRLDEIVETLEIIISRTHGRIAKSDKMLEVEKRFGKPIYELLAERKGKSVRFCQMITPANFTKCVRRLVEHTDFLRWDVCPIVSRILPG